MKRPIWTSVLTLALAAYLPPGFATEKQVVGWAEKVRIYPGNLVFHAKMDTGAKHSSINAKNIKYFERDGESWVRFDVVNRNRRKITLERPVFRDVTIKRHFNKTQDRPVVLLGVCLGKLYKEVQVNLVDRAGFIYEMLIGRSFMKKDILVNPSAQYTLRPKCPDAPTA